MQSESKSRLKIHTGVRPQEEMQKTAEPTAAQNEPSQNEPSQNEPSQNEPSQNEPSQAERRQAERKARTVRQPSKGRRKRDKEQEDRLSTGERLVRNSAVACALLLTVMAIKNVDQPWSRQATEGIRQAMTMRVDWDETLGKLSFVRALVPETALVFFNLSSEEGLEPPTEGEISHRYSEKQPWLEYSCAADSSVRAVIAGRVSAVGEGISGDWSVLIEDGEGMQVVCGYMADVYVRPGDEVAAGQLIGVTANTSPSRLYFELRENGQSIDPSERMR